MKDGCIPLAASIIPIIAMPFWASLAPWENPSQAILKYLGDNKSETGDDTNGYCGFHGSGCNCSGHPVRGIVKTIGKIKQRNG